MTADGRQACVLVPVDFSEMTDRVTGHAANLARALKARLTLLHVVPPDPAFVGYEPGPQSVRDAVAKQYQNEHKRLRDLEAKIKGEGVEVAALIVQGYTAEKILKEAQSLKAGLIIMGSHSRGALHHLLVGSVTEAVLRKATCPVVIVPSAA
jgi:nucleotide-binding universal stress UspA family protein